MIKIGHLGSYDRNIGDNIALLNIRNEFEKQLKSITWKSFDIGRFHDQKNNPNWIINKINDTKLDALLVGGGGLVEFENYEDMRTYYKLPFNKNILKELNVPVFFAGVGINIFRGLEGYTELAKKAFEETICHSKHFSLRNDGSINKLKKMDLYSDKVMEIPDPGLIFDYQKDDIVNTKDIKNTYFQPAFNGSEEINDKRGLNDESMKLLGNLCIQKNLKIIPHTSKDFKYKKSYLPDDNYIFGYDDMTPVLVNSEAEKIVKFENTKKSVDTYLNYDFGISMRGHGQLISIGLNIPNIYLSTQDKVRDFSMLNGFEDYDVDINESDWYRKLKEKYNRMMNDEEYLKNWYVIRNKGMSKWRKQILDFTKKCMGELNA